MTIASSQSVPPANSPRRAPAGRPPGAPRGADPAGRPPGAPRGADPGGRPPGAPRGADPGGRPPGAPRGADPGGRPPGAPRGAPQAGQAGTGWPIARRAASAAAVRSGWPGPTSANWTGVASEVAYSRSPSATSSAGGLDSSTISSVAG